MNDHEAEPRIVVTVLPPGDEARHARQADEIAVAALNAVDPHNVAWLDDPVGVYQAALLRMDQAKQLLAKRMVDLPPAPEAA